mgnify:CR=1 FL=1
MNSKAQLFTAILTIAIQTNVYSKEVYVSPNGNDNSDGSYEFPLKTLEKARDVVRPYVGKEDVIVYLRGGTYNTPLIIGLGKACEITITYLGL